MIDIVDKFNMVDMGGIDIVESQGTAVEGLFTRLLNAIQRCQYQILYNWKFAQIEIVPSPSELLFDGEKVSINGAITVTEDDVVHIYSLEPEPIAPVIEPLTVTENGEYEAPSGVDGYAPVAVNVSCVMSNYADVLYFEQGGVANATAINDETYPRMKISSNATIRTQALFPIIFGTTYNFEFNDSVYEICLEPFNWSATSWGGQPDASIYHVWKDSVTLTGQGGYIAFVFRKKDGTNITPSEIINIGFNISIS